MPSASIDPMCVDPSGQPSLGPFTAACTRETHKREGRLLVKFTMLPVMLLSAAFPPTGLVVPVLNSAFPAANWNPERVLALNEPGALFLARSSFTPDSPWGSRVT